MKSKFAMFTVCSLAVLSCMAILPSTVSSTMEEQAEKHAAFSDHEKGVKFPKNCDSRAARETAGFKCNRGMETIFNTTKIELVKVSRGNKNVHDSSDVETGHAETDAAWEAMIDVIFHTIPRNHPLAFSKYRDAAVFAVKNATEAIYTGIIVTLSSRSCETLMEVETLENTTACQLRKLASKIYADILKGRKHDPHIDAVLECHRKNTVLAAVTSVRHTFDATRILLSAIFSEDKTRTEDDLSSITVLSNKALVNCEDWIREIFDAIELICPLYSK